jgi:anti-sigma factor RsiW
VKHCSPYGLSRYLDGELRLPDRREIESHLKVCHHCADELEVLRRLDREVRLWSERRRPIPVQSEMRILETVERRRRARPVRALGRMIPAAVGSSIAALLVLVSVNWGSLYPGSTRVASQAATVPIQPSRAIQAPLALDVVRVRQITGQRGSAHPDLEARYRNLNRGMVNLD